MYTFPFWTKEEIQDAHFVPHLRTGASQVDGQTLSETQHLRNRSWKDCASNEAQPQWQITISILFRAGASWIDVGEICLAKFSVVSSFALIIPEFCHHMRKYEKITFDTRFEQNNFSTHRHILHVVFHRCCGSKAGLEALQYFLKHYSSDPAWPHITRRGPGSVNDALRVQTCANDPRLRLERRHTTKIKYIHQRLSFWRSLQHPSLSQFQCDSNHLCLLVPICPNSWDTNVRHLHPNKKFDIHVSRLKMTVLTSPSTFTPQNQSFTPWKQI